jgi:hypothetical protein
MHDPHLSRRRGVCVHALGGAAAPGGLEVDTDATAWEGPDGVVSEGRAPEISAESPLLFAVTAVGGGRGVEVHAEGGRACPNWYRT